MGDLQLRSHWYRAGARRVPDEVKHGPAGPESTFAAQLLVSETQMW